MINDMKDLAKKLAKKVLRNTIAVSRPVLDVDSKQVYYPTQWKLFGYTIYSSYILATEYHQDEHINIL